VLAEQYNANMDCVYARPGGTAKVLRDEAIWVALTHLSMATSSDVFVYTRYFPRFLGEPPGTSLTTLQPAFQTELADHFSQMGAWSDLATAWGVTLGDLAIVIQEVSYSSAYNSGGGLSDLMAHAIAYQQGPFASATFNTWNAYNSAAQSAQTAQVLSLNWFNLHDFPSIFCDLVQGGNYFPFCAWGLWTNDHQEKQTGDPFLTTSWVWYLLPGLDQNPPESDPARCLF
jgi:hypothetical protein